MNEPHWAGDGLPESPNRSRSVRLVGVICVAAVAYALASRRSWRPRRHNPESAATDYEAALADASRPLAELYANGDALIPEGSTPMRPSSPSSRDIRWSSIWASWCGRMPQFPLFQRAAAEYGDRVAFLGVDSLDTDPAAETFLEQFPVPYPSITDPDREIWDELRLRGLPGTAFYAPDGELEHLKERAVHERGRSDRRDRAIHRLADNPSMRPRAHIWLWSVLAGLLLLPGAVGAQSSQTVPSIELSGTIDPATEKWIGFGARHAKPTTTRTGDHPPRHPGRARHLHAGDHPVDPRRPMPVVVYVSPNGAGRLRRRVHHRGGRRGGDGLDEHRLGERGHVHRRGHRGHAGRKIENDAAAFIRALAEDTGETGRSPSGWSPRPRTSPRPRRSTPNAIDIVAASEEELLAELDGYEVQGPKAQTLDTAGFVIDERDMPLQYELLQILVNPTVAYLLLLVGLVGIAIEIFSLGLFIPGASGWRLLGAHAAQLGHRQRESRCSSSGSVHHRRGPSAHERGSWAGSACSRSRYRGCCSSTPDRRGRGLRAAVIAVAVLVGGFFVFATRKVVLAHRRPKLTGWEEMIGATGDIRVPLDPVGQAGRRRALWPPASAEGARDGDADRVRNRGARVRVESIEGLTRVQR